MRNRKNKNKLNGLTTKTHDARYNRTDTASERGEGEKRSGLSSSVNLRKINHSNTVELYGRVRWIISK